MACVTYTVFTTTSYMYGRGLISVATPCFLQLFSGCDGGQTVNVTARVIHLLLGL